MLSADARLTRDVSGLDAFASKRFPVVSAPSRFLSPGTVDRSLARDEDGRNVPPRRTGKKVPEAIAFGKRVRELRLARGWTQERLAEESNLNAVQVSHIERGANEPKLTTILRLARALRVSPIELLR